MRLLSPFRGLFDPTCPKQLKKFLTRFPPSTTASEKHRGVDGPACTQFGFIKAIYAARPDLREAFPLGLTPHQREAFATWLFEHGRPDLGLTDEEIIGYLKLATRDPSHGLAHSWLLVPKLQARYPEALSSRGWPSFKVAVANDFRITQRWIRQAKLPREFLQTSSQSGVNILAHFRYPSGLQEEAVQYASAIQAHGHAVSLRDAPIGVLREGGEYLGAEIHPITLAKLGACESLDEQYPLTGWHPRRGVYRIVCWSWELDVLPRRLAGKAELADEIWTPSEFCAKAVRGAFPEKTVTAMLPAVSLPSFEKKPRSHFGLPADRFLFLFVFDIGSVMERKNPLGLIDAFKRAFRSDDRAHLAIKVTRGTTRLADLAKLQAAANRSISIIDRVLPRENMVSLLDSCDAYVSLHRAEGFGFTIAEAMLLGKPTIATGYSANMEFMTADTAFAVNHSLAPVGEGHSPYPAEALWAEPCREHAASLMRDVFENRQDGQAVGTRASLELPKLLAPVAAGHRMLARLDAIRKNLPRLM